jgi:O-antigen/teichoic acid export membrane protein
MQDPEELRKLLRKSFDLMLIFAVPIGLGVMMIAQPVVNLLYGPAFTQSGPVLSLLGGVLILSYLTTLIGRFLIATDRQGIWAMVMLVSATAAVPLDLLFVPWAHQLFGNGAIGGATSYFITELAMVVFGIRSLPAGSLNWSNVSAGGRTVFAGLAMAAITWFFRDMFVIIPILVGAAAYLLLVLGLRIIPREDMRLIAQMAQRILGRIRQRKAAVGAEGL